MKIVLINYRYFLTSGAEAFMFKFKELLEAHGHTVIPFSTQNEKNESTPYEKYFCKARSSEGEVLYTHIPKTPANIKRMLAGAFYNRDAEKCLTRLLEAEKPDIVFVLQQMNTLSPSIFRAAKKAEVPVIHRLSDFNMICPRYDCLRDGKPCTDCINGNYSHAVRHACVKGSKAASIIRSASMKFHSIFRLFGSISRFVAPAAFTCKLLEKSGIPKEKLVHLPTFIDASKYEVSEEKGKHFLFLGRLSPEKGVEDLIKALPLMKAKDAKVVLAGGRSESYAAELDALVSKLLLEDRVEFLGFAKGDKLKQAIADSIAIVLPAVWYENMPNAVLEAYAYGKPVIVSDIGSLPEMVEDGVTGYMCKPNEPSSLAEMMDKMVEVPDKCIEMGRAARRRCEEMYSPDKYYKKIEALFQSVLKESAGAK